MFDLLLWCFSARFRRWYRADTARIQAEAGQLHEQNERLRQEVYG